MNKAFAFTITVALLATTVAQAQPRGRRGGPPGGGIGDTNPLAIGDSGVAWYTTWKTGLAEAKRSNRPIFFMSAATTCSGVSGVF